MDDVMMMRFALDNVHLSEIAEPARRALDRRLDGEAFVDLDSPDGRRYEQLRRGRGRHEPTQPSILRGLTA